MNPQTRKYLSKIGKKGGSKSRRTLSTKTARKMATLRWDNKRRGMNSTRLAKGGTSNASSTKPQ